MFENVWSYLKVLLSEIDCIAVAFSSCCRPWEYTEDLIAYARSSNVTKTGVNMRYRLNNNAQGVAIMIIWWEDVWSRFKDHSWSVIFTMFYLNVFYFPALKQVVGQYKMWNDESFWFSQMIYFNFYIPLFTRQANGLDNIYRMSLHQQEQYVLITVKEMKLSLVKMLISNVSQCHFYFYHHIDEVNLWTSSTLNDILVTGNNLYSSLRYSVERNGYVLLTVPFIASIYVQMLQSTYHYPFSALNLQMDS